jgi:hypothetical protein
MFHEEPQVAQVSGPLALTTRGGEHARITGPTNSAPFALRRHAPRGAVSRRRSGRRRRRGRRDAPACALPRLGPGQERPAQPHGAARHDVRQGRRPCIAQRGGARHGPLPGAPPAPHARRAARASRRPAGRPGASGAPPDRTLGRGRAGGEAGGSCSTTTTRTATASSQPRSARGAARIPPHPPVAPPHAPPAARALVVAKRPAAPPLASVPGTARTPAPLGALSDPIIRHPHGSGAQSAAPGLQRERGPAVGARTRARARRQRDRSRAVRVFGAGVSHWGRRRPGRGG